MKFIFPFLSILLAKLALSQDAIPPIGQWREHLPYNSTIDVTAGSGKMFAATPYSLFAVNIADDMIERYSRITGLNETGISAIQYDAVNNKLLVAYTNSNIDIIHRNDIYNVPDIKQDNITGDKSIYNIYPRGNDFYLSTGLGVVVVDGERYEVKDTWFIGNSGNQVRVNGFTSDGSFFYAATTEGLKKVAVNSPNPANYANWQMISGTNGLSAGSGENVFMIQNKVVVQKNDSLFVQNGNTWSLLYTGGWVITNSNTTENKIQLCERSSNNSRVQILNPDGSGFRSITNSIISLPKKVLLHNNEAWIADQNNSLLRFNAAATTFQSYKLNSPQGTATGEIVVYNSIFYGSSGSVSNSWLPQNNSDGLYQFSEGSWTNFNSKQYNQLDSLKDFISIAIDKRDASVWASSFGGGLLHIKAGPAFEIFKQTNLGAAISDPAAYEVAGLAFDSENNLWVSNYGSAQPLKVRKADGSWRNFAVPFSLNENALSQIIIDDNNYKWIVSPKGNGLLCYEHGTSIDITTDDQWRRFGIGAGNLPSNDVLCVAKDKNGFIWIGTGDGVAVIQCPELSFSNPTCDAVWPVVPNGSFAGYLFKGQEVRSIAVDGADRKWVATKKGAFLISATGEKVIYQFTETNSPLPSSDISKIAIDSKTGEVYFATAKGICSFRSTATEGGESNENVLVFPNPVPPGYSGTIAIRGLVNNAIVKITEMDGKLVYQTRALGGQAVWDGKNYKGQKIASGAYLVLVADEGRKERVATKIFYIAK